MKTTIDIPDHLMAQVKELAATQGVTMRELMLDGLRREIAQRSEPVARADFVFTTYAGQGLQPGIEPSALRALAYDLPS